jgi:hypothetical protein
LVVAALFINGEFAEDLDLRAIVEIHSAKLGGLAGEHHAGDLGRGILQREVKMSRTLAAEVRDFALHPNLANTIFQ